MLAYPLTWYSDGQVLRIVGNVELGWTDCWNAVDSSNHPRPVDQTTSTPQNQWNGGSGEWVMSCVISQFINEWFPNISMCDFTRHTMWLISQFHTQQKTSVRKEGDVLFGSGKAWSLNGTSVLKVLSIVCCCHCPISGMSFLGMHRNENSWPKPNILKKSAESRNRIPNMAFAVFHSFYFNFSPLHKSNN
jgi:hypothetical protein